MSGFQLLRSGDETTDQHAMRVAEPGISRWKTSLAVSDDPRRQAIALALANARPRANPEDERTSKDTPVNNSLVLLAMETDDPAIYALALRQCGGDSGYDMAPGPCQGLSWEHWALIDPDNAVPWLWVAAKANREGDQQRVEDALAKAASAPGIQAKEAALNEQAWESIPNDAPPLEKAVAGAEILSIMPASVPIAITSLCSGAAIQRSPRKEQCSAIATVLQKQGSTVIDVAVASRLADRLGFPQDTQAALAAEAKSMRAAIRRTIPYPWGDLNGGAAFGCSTVLGYDSYIDALRAVRGNERAALAMVARTSQMAK